MSEIRCPFCNRLLFKIEGGRESQIETVCPRCKRGLLLVIDRAGFGQLALDTGKIGRAHV